MPTINVSSATRQVSAHPDLTVGGEPTRVVFDSETVFSVEVINRGAGAVWYTLDGSTPVVKGPRCYYLPSQTADVRRSQSWREPTVVSLIAEAATAVSVQRVG